MHIHYLKIAREYNSLSLNKCSFNDLKNFLKSYNKKILNYGLHPQLGKYYRSYCTNCERTCSDILPPVINCPVCNNKETVVGVLDRIIKITGRKDIIDSNHPSGKYGNYKYQIPLEELPGIGKKNLR